MPRSRQLRTVNRILGTQPRLGPFPADQIIPWAAILLISYMVVKEGLQASWLVTGIVAAWAVATWWVVSSNKSFLGKFVGTPRVTRGYKPSISFTNPPSPERKKRLKNRNEKKARNLS